MLSRLRFVPRVLCVTFTLLLVASCNADKTIAPVINQRAAARDVAPVDTSSGISLSFNGSTSGAATPLGQPVTQSANVVIQAMFKWNGPTSSDVEVIAYNGFTGRGGWGVIILDGKLGILDGGVTAFSTGITPSVGVWHHLYVSRSGNNLHVVLDDVVKETAAAFFDLDPATSRTMIGAAFPLDPSGPVNAVFNGEIDNVRFSALDGTTIEDWNFDDATATTAVGADGAVLTLTDVTRLGHALLHIVIDPRHENRVIEPDRVKRIAVALLSNPGFDARTVDPSTVTFGPGHAPVLSAERADVDHDGDRDVIYRFDMSATGITCLDRTVSLSATVDGVLASGVGAIHTVVADLPAFSYMVRCASPRIIASDLAPDDPNFIPLGINDRGTVSAISYGGVYSAALWNDGRIQRIANVGSEPFASSTSIINARGQIGLAMTTPTGDPDLFVWSGGTPTHFSVPPTVEIFPFVGDQGDPVGTSLALPSRLETLWHVRQNGKLETVTAPAGGSFNPLNVTNGGVVGGGMTLANGEGHPFLWNGKKVTDLGRAGESVNVVAMNHRGQLLGFLTDPMTGEYHPRIWSNDGTVSIASLLYPEFINDRGDAFLIDVNAGDGFFWRDGQATPIAVGQQTGYSVVALNDQGQMLSYGPDFNTPSIYQPDGSSLSLMGGQLTQGGSPVAFNNNGEVIGYAARPDGQWRSMIWRITKK